MHDDVGQTQAHDAATTNAELDAEIPGRGRGVREGEGGSPRLSFGPSEPQRPRRRRRTPRQRRLFLPSDDELVGHDHSGSDCDEHDDDDDDDDATMTSRLANDAHMATDDCERRRRRRRRQLAATTTTAHSRRILRLPWLRLLALCWLGAVAAAPLRGNGLSSEEMTLSIADGYIPYSIGNDTGLREISRSAFFSLHGTAIEAKLPPAPPHGDLDATFPDEPVGSPTPPRAPLVHSRKKDRRPGGKKKILDGRKTALMSLADPDALRMSQKCEGQKFKQRVKVAGCLTKVIVNRLCHGTCASYFIPRMHSKKLKASFKSCATCAPSEYDFVDVTLDCPGQTPAQVTRPIIKVKQCRCRDVDLSSLNL